MHTANILLGQGEHVKICDFGLAQQRGCSMDSPPCAFYRPVKHHPVARPVSEQFAIGSCIYNIRIGKIPDDDAQTSAEAKQMYAAFARGRPPTA